ncbi:MAG: carbohydrate binding domain-containing protein [Taibaiella sp.]|nr:carbohydrate binding domain-containing protein [Taibaiella sp.]
MLSGGWRSPGIAQQIAARPGETYKVSFWIKNEDGHFIAKIAGITATTGQSEVIVDTASPLSDWTLFEHTYVIPQEMNALRFELSILSKGTLWIDDVKLERL